MAYNAMQEYLRQLEKSMATPAMPTLPQQSGTSLNASMMDAGSLIPVLTATAAGDIMGSGAGIYAAQAASSLNAANGMGAVSAAAAKAKKKKASAAKNSAFEKAAAKVKERDIKAAKKNQLAKAEFELKKAQEAEYKNKKAAQNAVSEKAELEKKENSIVNRAAKAVAAGSQLANGINLSGQPQFTVDEELAQNLYDLGRARDFEQTSKAAGMTDKELTQKDKLSSAEKNEIYTRYNTWLEDYRKQNPGKLAAYTQAQRDGTLPELLKSGEHDDIASKQALYSRLSAADKAVNRAQAVTGAFGNMVGGNLLFGQMVSDPELLGQLGGISAQTQNQIASGTPLTDFDVLQVQDAVNKINAFDKETSVGYNLVKGSQQATEFGQLGMSDTAKALENAALSAAENIALAAVNPALVLPVLSAQGAGDAVAEGVDKGYSSDAILANALLKFGAGYAINSIGVAQMLDTMGVDGARNTIASAIVRGMKSAPGLKTLGQLSPTLYAMAAGGLDNGLQSFAETYADKLIDNIAYGETNDLLGLDTLAEAGASGLQGALGGAASGLGGSVIGGISNRAQQGIDFDLPTAEQFAQQNEQTNASQDISGGNRGILAQMLSEKGLEPVKSFVSDDTKLVELDTNPSDVLADANNNYLESLEQLTPPEDQNAPFEDYYFEGEQPVQQRTDAAERADKVLEYLGMDMDARADNKKTAKLTRELIDDIREGKVGHDEFMKRSEEIAERITPHSDYHQQAGYRHLWDEPTYNEVHRHIRDALYDAAMVDSVDELSAEYRTENALDYYEVADDNAPVIAEDYGLGGVSASTDAIEELNPGRPDSIGAHTGSTNPLVESQTNSIKALAESKGMTTEEIEVLGDQWHEQRSIKQQTDTANNVIARNGLEATAQNLISRNGNWADGDSTVAYNAMQQLMEQMKSETDADRKADLWVQLQNLTNAFNENVSDAAREIGYLGNMTKELSGANVLISIEGALGNGKHLTQEQGTRIVDLVDQMVQLNPNSKAFDELRGQVTEIVAEAMGPGSWKDKLNSFRYVSMLSSILRTGGKNVIGNENSGALARIKNGVVKPMLEATLGKKIGATKTSASFLTKSQAVKQQARLIALEVYNGEAYGLARGASKYDAAQNVKKSTLVRDIIGEAKHNRDNLSSIPIIGKLAARWAAAESKTYTGQDDLGAIKTLEFLSLLGEDSKIYKAAQNVMGKAIAGADAKGVTIGFGGLQNNFVDSFSRSLVANGITSMDQLNADPVLKQKLIENAARDAKEATFHDDNKLTELAKSISNLPGVGADILPFARTPANVTMRGLEYSPIGLAFAAKSAATKNADACIDYLAKGMTGTALMALGALAAKAGLLTGVIGNDKKDKYEKTTKGLQKYSLNLGPLLRDLGIQVKGNATISLEAVNPSLMPLMLGATLAREENGLMEALLAVADPIMEMGFMSGVSDIIGSVRNTTDDGESIGMIAQDIVLGYLGQFEPTILKQLGRSTQKYRQSYYSSKDTTLGRAIDYNTKQMTSWIPVLGDEQNTDYIDQWGRRQENPGGNIAGRLAYNMASPAYYVQGQPTSVDNDLEELYDLATEAAKENPAIKPDNVYPNSGISDGTIKNSGVNGGRPYRLNEKEMEKFAERKGKISYELVEQLMNSSSFHRLEVEKQVKAVDKMYDIAKQLAYLDTLDGYKLRDNSEYNKWFDLYRSRGTSGIVSAYLK